MGDSVTQEFKGISKNNHSKSLEDVLVINKSGLRRNKSNENISGGDKQLDISSVMHDDSKTQVYEASRKLQKRRSKQNLDSIKNKPSHQVAEKTTISPIDSISKHKNLPPPVRLEFSPESKRKSPLPSILKRRSSSVSDPLPIKSNVDIKFDDQDDLIGDAPVNDDSSTVKDSVETIKADSDIKVDVIESNRTYEVISDSDRSYEDIDESADPNNVESKKVDLLIVENETSLHDEINLQTHDMMSDNNSNSQGNIQEKGDLTDNVNAHSDTPEKSNDAEDTNQDQRAVTPFFLKQVDISDAILKVDPKLTKDLSLISVDSANKKVRKSRGESLLSHGGSSAYSRSSTAGEGDTSNVRVTVRVRPMNSIEKQRGDKNVIEFPGDGGIWVHSALNQTKPFTFNAVFQEDYAQDLVFNKSGITDLIDKALDGFSCTAFAFGQTGSGKTYTITGPPDQSAEDMLSNGGSYGMVPRSFRYLFEEIGKRPEINYCVKASFLEVYNEKVKDLLHPSNAVDSLPLRWSSKTGFYVDNLFMMECETVEELMEALIKGSTYRQVGEHAMNDHSSRSHTMLTVYVHSEEVDTDEDTNGFVIARRGKISFVDLAGSEKVKETKTSGETLIESNNINKSLLTLGNCISGLGDPRKKGQHIPYRESKLTKLLSDSLGGEGFTLMIACISPSSYVLQDTMNTLRYANRAKNIRNKPVVKMDPKEQLLQRMKRELKLLRAENLYFRQQLGVPCSESQVIITPSQIKGELTPNEHSGALSPAIGNGTFSSTQSSRYSSSKDLGSERGKEDSINKDESFTPRATTALYALGAKNGLYNMLQEYMNENASLKAENMELHRTRAVARHQQEELFRENDRLAKKLDDVGRVMLSTPVSREHVRSWLSRNTPPVDIFSRQKTDDTLTLDTGSVRSHGSGVKFPPVRQGTYPNYVYNQDVVTELQNEKSKLQEHEKILMERSDQMHTAKLTNDGKVSEKDPAKEKSDDKLSENKENIDKEEKKLPTQSGQTAGTSTIKQEGRFKRAVLSKAWKNKKKAVTATTTNEKQTSYAAQFAVRKNLLSKQNPTNQNANKNDTKDVTVPSHQPTQVNDGNVSSQAQYVVQHRGMQQYAQQQHQGVLQYAQQQQQDVLQYPQQHLQGAQQYAHQQQQQGILQYPQQNFNTNPYMNTYSSGYYPTQGNAMMPYGNNVMAGYPVIAQDMNANHQHLQHDLTSHNVQATHENKPKKAKPKR